jgi:flavin-dependent dehydrogenase
MKSPTSTDIFVIGGGPAGLAIAIAARQRGFRVQLADGAEPPIDKACGEGLLPDGVAALESLGIEIPRGAARSFCGIRFLSRSRTADACFSGTRPGFAVRRTTLHRMLTDRASQVGATLLWRTPVTGIASTGVILGERFVRARWIIGADGANSRVRRWAGLGDRPPSRLRYAFRQHYRVPAWTDRMEVYWGERCQGYATAVSPDQLCVAIASHDRNLRLEDGLRELPRLQARLQGAEILNSERGATTANSQYRRIWRDNVALIGDASGTVDAITGQGLGLSFSQAFILSECLIRSDLARYQREHRRLSLRPLWMARLMLTLDQRPRLQERTLHVFARRPEIFRRLLELHVGTLPPTQVVRDGLTLGWGLLTA